MEEIKNNFAKNLSNYRKNENLTQVELAFKLNYSDKAVSKWERAESIPDILTLKQIADYFGITVDTLISTPKPPKPTKSKTLSKKRLIIASAVTLFVWLMATALFCFLNILFPAVNNTWMFFIYAVPITTVILFSLTYRWGNKFINMMVATIFIWTIILSVYLSLIIWMSNPPTQLWMIFLIGIPLQILIILAFYYKKLKKKVD